MTVAKTTTKKAGKLIEKIDWIDLGIKSLALLGTAFVSGYVSAAAGDMYHSRKVKRIANEPDSNVLLMENAQ